jgi:uncharacterized protein (DUF111 family)
MVVLSKIVTQYNQQGKIVMPLNTVGMEFYVVSKEELDRNFEYIERAMIKQKIYEEELQKIKLDLEQFKNISNSRITYLKRIISMTTEKTQIKDKNDENKIEQ